MDNTAGVIVVIIFFGLMGVGLVSLLMSATGSFYHQKVLAACEESLPRNEHCVLMAVPESAQSEGVSK